jgi:hypothetical protein
MTPTNLTTAKFYQETAGEAEVPKFDAAHIAVLDEYPNPKHGAPATSGERMMRWLSITMAVAVIVCVTVVAVPYVASVSSHAPKNPIDWWLRLGGAGQDQTFQKFVKDAATKQQQEIQAQFHPAIEGTIDLQNLNWQPLQSVPVASHKR